MAPRRCLRERPRSRSINTPRRLSAPLRGPAKPDLSINSVDTILPSVGFRLAIAWLVVWCAVAQAQTAPKDHKLSLANGHSKLACKACHDKGVGTPPSKGNQCKDC